MRHCFEQRCRDNGKVQKISQRQWPAVYSADHDTPRHPVHKRKAQVQRAGYLHEHDERGNRRHTNRAEHFLRQK